MKKMMVFIPALDLEIIREYTSVSLFDDLDTRELETISPLAAPSYAMLRTGKTPAVSGITGNGIFDRIRGRAFFGEPSSACMEGGRIWEEFRHNGGKVIEIGLPHSIGTDCDFFALTDKNSGKEKRLSNFPSAVKETGSEDEWYSCCIENSLEKFRHEENGLIFASLPDLFHTVCRYGKRSKEARKIFLLTESLLDHLKRSAENCGFEFYFAGIAPCEDVHHVIRPNFLLKDAGWLQISAEGVPLPQISRAFAVADQQTAHVYLPRKEDMDDLKMLFGMTRGIGSVMERSLLPEMDHPHAGELILEADEGCRFSSRINENDSIEESPYSGCDPSELILTGSLFRKAKLEFLPDSAIRAACGRRKNCIWGGTRPLPETCRTFMEAAEHFRTGLKGASHAGK